MVPTTLEVSVWNAPFPSHTYTRKLQKSSEKILGEGNKNLLKAFFYFQCLLFTNCVRLTNSIPSHFQNGEESKDRFALLKNWWIFNIFMNRHRVRRSIHNSWSFFDLVVLRRNRVAGPKKWYKAFEFCRSVFQANKIRTERIMSKKRYKSSKQFFRKLKMSQK